MKSIIFKDKNKILFGERLIPTPDKDEYLIRVHYSGVCGTDIHIIHGHSPAKKDIILGHELCGEITKAGSSALKYIIGEMVAINPNNHCCRCEFCLKNQPHFCNKIFPIGVQRNGGWAEYVVVPENLIYPLPDNILPGWGALAEPLSCILHGQELLQPIKRNSNILIIGGGLIGLLWALILKPYQYNVHISEPNAVRREIAKNLGIPVKSPNVDQLPESCFDIIVDCSGNKFELERAVTFLRPAGKLLLFGIVPEGEKIQIQPYEIFRKEISIIGSFLNPGTFEQAIGLIPEIQIPAEKIGIKFYQLSEYSKAITDVKSQNILKAIFTPAFNLPASAE